MTTLQLQVQARAPARVQWDRARELRVLGLALALRRRRARSRMAFELGTALVITCVAGRVLPHASVEHRDAPASATRAIEVPPASEMRPNGVRPELSPELVAPEMRAPPVVKDAPIGGFAGTGGHGGARSNGHGGNAGTG